METIAGAVLIFLLRVTDVSIGTLRMLSAVRGQRLIAAGLGLVESGVFVFAISRVFKDLDTHPWNMVGYACGFAAGNALGITIERWIGSGWLLARIISREKCRPLLDALRRAGFGVTVVEGHGIELDVLILFIVTRRRRGEEMLRLVRSVDPDAFVTTEAVHHAAGGYLPHTAAPMAVRK
jgi:uncharacterized protein YebE (UPF0316 family)